MQRGWLVVPCCGGRSHCSDSLHLLNHREVLLVLVLFGLLLFDLSGLGVRIEVHLVRVDLYNIMLCVSLVAIVVN